MTRTAISQHDVTSDELAAREVQGAELAAVSLRTAVIVMLAVSGQIVPFLR